MIEFDVDMGYLLEAGELDCVILNDENGEYEPMKFTSELGSGTCKMIPLCSWLFECSKCGERHHKDDLRKYKYCPNCGAKVVRQ